MQLHYHDKVILKHINLNQDATFHKNFVFLGFSVYKNVKITFFVLNYRRLLQKMLYILD